MRTANYSEREISERRDRVRSYQNDNYRNALINEMCYLMSVGTTPFVIVDKTYSKVLQNGYKWVNNSLEMQYNRLTIALYEYENSKYSDLFK